MAMNRSCRHWATWKTIQPSRTNHSSHSTRAIAAAVDPDASVDPHDDEQADEV